MRRKNETSNNGFDSVYERAHGHKKILGRTNETNGRRNSNPRRKIQLFRPSAAEKAPGHLHTYSAAETSQGSCFPVKKQNQS